MTRSKAAAVALIVVTTAIAVATFVVASQQIGRPFPGFLVGANEIVSQFQLPDWPGPRHGLRFNDRIVAVDGASVTSGTEVWEFARSIPPGTHVEYRVVRYGVTGANAFDATIPTRIFGVGDFLTVFLTLWAPAALAAVSGFLLLAIRPHDRPVRALFGLSIWLSLLLFTAFDFYSTYLFLRLTPLASAASIAWAFLFQFTLVDQSGVLRLRQWPRTVAYVAAAIAGFGLQATMFSSVEVFVLFTYAAFTLGAISLMTYVGLLVLTMRRSRSSSLRRQARIQVVGVGIAVGVPLLTMTVSTVARINFPVTLLIPIGAGIAFAGPYSVACLLEEEAVISLFFRERYRRVQSLRLLSERLVTATSLPAITSVLESSIRESLACRSQLVLVDQRLDFSTTERSLVDGLPADSGRPAIPLEVDGIVLGTLVVGPRADGEEFSDEDTLLLESFGNLASIAIQRALAADKLRALNEHLERRVKARTAALEDKNRALSELNSELELYTNALSHDVRGPLAAAASALAMADKQAPDGGPQFHRFLGTGREGVRTARQMLDGMLLITRAGHEAEPAAEVDLGTVVNEIVEEMQLQQPESDIVFGVVEPLPRVQGQLDKLRHVFRNLLGNAIKYVGETAHPEITIGEQIGSDKTVIFVRDNGVGIPPAYCDRIFEPFHRVPPGDTIPSAGIGIGLAVVKRIMQQHRGRVWVESTPGLGAAFFLEFPRAESGEASFESE